MILRIGSRGSAVRELQTLLGITADGIFGSQTHQAVVNFQRANRISVDGIVGPQTWRILRIQQNSTPPSPTNFISKGYNRGTARIIETTPENIELRVLRNNLRNANVNGLSGTFFWPISPASAQNANGIIVNSGTIIGDAASHAWRNFPHSVLCYYSDRTLGVERVLAANQISKPVIWAIGGVGLLPNFSPASEGYSGTYADVLRYVTAAQGGHTWIGFKDGKVYLYWRTNCNRESTKQDAIQMGMQGCVGLDGGGSAQIRHPQITDAHTTRLLHNAIVLKQV